MIQSLSRRNLVPSKQVGTLADDVREGLLKQPMTLPPKHFYDAVGSQLFDTICATPEYYLTRHESALLAHHADAIIQQVRPDCLIEFGSGVSRKTRYLLDACPRAEYSPLYVPFDVCADVIDTAGNELMRHYPWLKVLPLVGDYGAGLGNLALSGSRALIMFLGSTIGNFDDESGTEFLHEIRHTMRAQDYLLLGADRVKDPAVLHAAYNDAAGLTAQFNLNVLEVMNRELNANFNLQNFRHYACYNVHAAQIEMYLASAVTHEVAIADLDLELEFAAGDAILTEISRKFTLPALDSMLQRAGLSRVAHFASPDDAYSLVLARPDDHPGFPRLVK